MPINLPESGRPRIVVVGAGFAGMSFLMKMRKSDFQVVLIDKNNYHQFQPLFYQVAMAGLEPSSISFPLRKAFQGCPNVYIRVAEVSHINTEAKQIETNLGHVNYDFLVIASGAVTNYFGNERLMDNTYGLKSVGEALALRNAILYDYERALTERDYHRRQGLVDVAIVGGGPTGVELAGALAEMKSFILPKDYRELNNEEVDIYLIQGGDRLLPGMSEKSGKKAYDYLVGMGVKVMLNTRVEDSDGEYVITSSGERIQAQKVIWAAGIKGSDTPGINTASITAGNRIHVDAQHRVKGYEQVYAIGDVAYMDVSGEEGGHPQVAQVAIQQGKNLATNFLKNRNNPFTYKNKGSMATIGRNKAVVDLPSFSFTGIMAWILWLFVHLFSIIGVKNKVFVFLNWLWNYITYDQSLRLIINPKKKGPKRSD